MNDDISKFQNIPLSDLRKIIQTITSNYLTDHLDDPKFIIEMASPLITYIQRIQTVTNFSIIFPLELLPAPKSDIKKWGFRYSSILLKEQGSLKKYHQDMILSYTRFQPISPNQWKEIEEDAINSISVYYKEMRDKGVSTVNLKPEYKAMVDTHLNEYNSEAKELHEYLQSKKSKPFGCIVSLLFLSIVCIVITWLFDSLIF